MVKTGKLEMCSGARMLFEEQGSKTKPSWETLAEGAARLTRVISDIGFGIGFHIHVIFILCFYHI